MTTSDFNGTRKCPKDGVTCGMASCNGPDGFCYFYPGTGKTTDENHICPKTGQHCYSEICVLGQTCARQGHNHHKDTSAVHYETYHSKPYVPAPPCHEGQHFLGVLNEQCNIHLGKQSSFIGNYCQATKQDYKLLISLLGPDNTTQPKPGKKGKQVVFVNDEATAMVPESLLIKGEDESGEKWPRVPVLGIEWPDFGVLEALDTVWWGNLIDFLGTIKGDVGVYCMGGHGRTGTFASVFAGLTGMVDPHKVDVVDWLRKRYCEKVVESDKQLIYIEKILGCKLKVSGSKVWATTSSKAPDNKSTFVWDGKTNKLVDKGKKTAAKGCIDKSYSKRQMKRMLKKTGNWQGVRPAELVDLESFEVDGITMAWDKDIQGFKQLK